MTLNWSRSQGPGQAGDEGGDSHWDQREEGIRGTPGRPVRPKRGVFKALFNYNRI